MASFLILRLNEIINRIDERVSINPYTKTYALGRSLIAFGTLTVLLFNDLYYLYGKEALDVISNSSFLFNQINLFGLLGYDNLLWSKIISVLILLLVIYGIYPKITGILHFWIAFSFHNSALLLDGGDQIAMIFTFLLIPITLFDKRKNHWNTELRQSKTSKLIGYLAFIIISVQVSFIYFNTAVEKIYKLNDWVNGTALYYICNNSYFGLNYYVGKIMSFILNSELVFFFTWWVVLSHLILSYLLFLDRKKKKHFLWFSIAFHGSIAIFIGLYSFSIVMIGVLVLYILPFNYKFYYEKK